MTVTDHKGITLNYSEPKNIYDRVFVTHCKTGQKPERIGSIRRDYDIATETVTYQAYSENNEPIGKPSTDWQEMELNFQKYAYDKSRSELEQAWLRMMNRSNDLRNIREGKEQCKSRDLNR